MYTMWVMREKNRKAPSTKRGPLGGALPRPYGVYFELLEDLRDCHASLRAGSQ